MDKLKIYLDSCCYNRPFDDLSQERIKREAEAIEFVINLSTEGKLLIVSSEFTEYEIKRINNDEKREKVRKFYFADEYYVLTEKIGKYARYYQTFNMKTFDALHLAAAEANGADYLLTTDIDFMRISTRFTHKTKVTNPYDFLKEGIWRCD
jgi:predicted nucleic acid-binding protein